ncbi:MAG: phosphoribosylamine--glycine ligase [Woeseiaceae bacterium]
MKVLIVGGGGREHALAWKCAQSAGVQEVIVAPGNAGTASEPRIRNVAVAADDVDGLLELAKSESVELTVVGPEVPLVAGIADRFQAKGLACFGPTAAAARLEGSKAYAKDFLKRHAIPTAAHRSFTRLDAALSCIRDRGAPIVIKADGLAAGKGVVVAATVAEAERAATDMLGNGRFGAAGARIVVEEYLDGEEASFIVLTDGRRVLPLATSQDHKALDDGDRGPNTGGMGACSPAPVVDAAVEARILSEIIRPTLHGLHADGVNYMGFLYAGLMIGADGSPKVIEFNCRLGDPEAQPILLRLRSDLVGLIAAALEGRLEERGADWDPRAALGVVMAAGGYPGEYRKGDAISGLRDAAARGSAPLDCKVFHSGTALDGEHIVTGGGRVLCVVGLGDTVAAAADRAYSQVQAIRWRDCYYRNDIGYRAIARERGC